MRGEARARRKFACCASPRERERAQWRLRYAGRGAAGLASEPVAGTSEHDRAPNGRALRWYTGALSKSIRTKYEASVVVAVVVVRDRIYDYLAPPV